MRDTFNYQPYLSGSTINLRPLQLDDFERLFICASDPLIWAGHPSKDRYQRSVFTKWFDAAANSKGALIVIDNEQHEVVGTSRYYGFDGEKSEISIGYTFLSRNYWGGTTNAELKKLMLEHAFETVRTVWFHIAPENIRSQQAIQKVGAVYSHEEKKTLTGEEGTYFCFKIDKTDWQHGSPS